MNMLKEKILSEGEVYPNDVLKIDAFLNHQIDTKLSDEIGKEFYELFKDKKPNKILTIESSGIAIAVATSKYFDFIPVLFAKKNDSSNMSKDTYSSSVHSYTKNQDYNIHVSKEYLNENDRVLIIDDFLANGEAMNSLIDICKKANAQIVGCGAVVCKTYQNGENRIKELGYDVKVLARIKSLNDDGSIEIE